MGLAIRPLRGRDGVLGAADLARDAPPRGQPGQAAAAAQVEERAVPVCEAAVGRGVVRLVDECGAREGLRGCVVSCKMDVVMRAVCGQILNFVVVEWWGAYARCWVVDCRMILSILRGAS